MSEPIVNAIRARNKLFLSGPFGSGKTTLALQRIHWLLQQERIRGDDILVLVPQRTLARPYHEALRTVSTPPGAMPRVTTLASLARQSVELYWPLVAANADFVHPDREPTFLTLETSQYHMARFVDAAIQRGEFDGVRMERNRIISQILDNLNKATLHDFSIDQAYERLELALPGGDQHTARLNALSAARAVSHQFRRHCRSETLLDFSLQLEVFTKQILTHSWSRTHLLRSHRHLIVDNAEEDTAVAHYLIQEWMPELDSALIISDEDGGIRTFLGADPDGVETLRAVCSVEETLSGSHVSSAELNGLAWHVDRILRPVGPTAPGRPPTVNALAGVVIPEAGFRFFPQMIVWTATEIARLVHDEGVAPQQIAVLAPFVSDALRFSLQTALADRNIRLTTHRPSRALQDEPAARCLATLSALAHPMWGLRPVPSDVTLALTLSVADLDPVRASLLSQIVYPPRRPRAELGRFGDLEPAMQERIGYVLGEAYDQLREWLYAYRAETEFTPLDQFIARIFGEILSRPGFGFHDDFDAARVANQLVESARSFRWSLESAGTYDGEQDDSPVHFGLSYLNLLESGALGALYVPGWRQAEDAVFLAPAYTFLMRNQPVDIQFWLDIGSSGWWERLYQPLTHPYVLSARWPAGQQWGDLDEFSRRQVAMRRLLLGLIRRTRQRIYLGTSDYSESGLEQRGPLLNLINRLLASQPDPTRRKLQ